MELSAAVAEAYLRGAFAKMLEVAERLGDERVNARPVGERTNAVGALVVHCCGVTGWWLGHVALARPSSRDRASELTAEVSLAELRALVSTTVAQASADLRRIDDGGSVAGSELRAQLYDGEGPDSSVVLHVIEELFQHLGHMEITADVLLARP